MVAAADVADRNAVIMAHLGRMRDQLGATQRPWLAPVARCAVIGPYPGPVDEVVRTAGEAMLTTPARHPPSATVREIRDFFRDDHVHAALIVSPAGYLESVVERDDIAGCQAPDAAAAPLGRLAGRTVPAGSSLAEVRQAMTATGRRRAAVTSADGRLLGLLCLKASRTGFCSDQDVRARAQERSNLLSSAAQPLADRF